MSRANRGHEYRERVGRGADGRPVPSYLAERYPHANSSEWRERIAAGLVRIDGQRVAADHVLQGGQVIGWHRPGWEEPAAPLGFAILHRDPDLLAVAKPSGLPTLPGGGFLEHTLLSLVRTHDPQASPLHRLGRFTSGIVLFARTHEARVGLSRQWANGSVKKRYRALASGTPDRTEFWIETPIGPVPHLLLGTVHGASPTGKRARTRVTVDEHRSGAFLCDVLIETGRPHQIRIHLAAAGHPLVGDPLYGPGGIPTGRGLPGDPGYRLHASELGFRHPRTGEELRLSCAPPVDLR